MGWNPGTADALDKLQAEIALAQKTALNAGRTAGTETYQTTNKLKVIVDALQEVVEEQQEQVERINKVVERIQRPRGESATTGSPVSIGSSWSDYASMSFTIPADCTRISAFASSSAYLAGSPDPIGMWLRTAIAGDIGEQIGAASIDVVGGASISHGATVNVTPGQTITVRAQAMKQSGSANMQALITCATQIIFL